MRHKRFSAWRQAQKHNLKLKKEVDWFQNRMYFAAKCSLTVAKKIRPMHSPKRKSHPDWHRADIKAALEKQGYSFARIAVEHGYARTSPYNVLRQPSAAIEKIVADIIGVHPSEIWPSRYDEFGNPKSIAKVPRMKRGGNG